MLHSDKSNLTAFLAMNKASLFRDNQLINRNRLEFFHFFLAI